MDVKTCSRCHVEKTLTDFNTRRRDGKIYLKSHCKTCQSNLFSEWRQKNDVYNRNRVKKWRTENIDRRAEYQRQWRKLNPHKPAEYQAAWHAKNPGYITKWSRANSQKCVARVARRKAEMLLATPKWADVEKIMSVYAEAARLTRETGIVHHVDHIVPMKSKIVCGLHWEENLRVLTRSENCSKNNRYWPDMP